MGNFLSEMIKLVRILSQENAWFRRALWACVAVLSAAGLWAARPRSPQVTAARYLEALRAGECNRAWRLVSGQRRGMMDAMGSFEAFDANVCQPAAKSYEKLYYEPWDGEKLEVFGGRADLKYCVCARATAHPRRMCAVHEAVLVREGLRWKILFMPIGPWDGESCRWERQKPETLIAPESRHKNPVRGK